MDSLGAEEFEDRLFGFRGNDRHRAGVGFAVYVPEEFAVGGLIAGLPYRVAVRIDRRDAVMGAFTFAGAVKL
jgi:hypothetical protein